MWWKLVLKYSIGKYKNDWCDELRKWKRKDLYRAILTARVSLWNCFRRCSVKLFSQVGLKWLPKGRLPVGAGYDENQHLLSSAAAQQQAVALGLWMQSSALSFFSHHCLLTLTFFSQSIHLLIFCSPLSFEFLLSCFLPSSCNVLWLPLLLALNSFLLNFVFPCTLQYLIINETERQN